MSAFGPELADHHDACERHIAHALSAGAMRAAMAETARLTAEQAIAYALDERYAAFPNDRAHSSPLTPKEREVAELVALGRSNREIAAALVVSPRTVDGHLERILAKLGFRSRVQVAAWVAEQQAVTAAR
jgi:DNA-binding NarL/FixJ family response regulator